MTNTAYPILCGGTFLTQILQSRKPTASRRQRTQGTTEIFREPDVMFGLMKLVQPDYIKHAGETFKTYTTNYKKCAEYTPDDLKFENETVIAAFLERLETDYTAELGKTTAFVNRFIDIGTTTQNDVFLVKRLIEVIRDDRSINDETKFVIGRDATAITKRELIEVEEVYLPAFLLDIWKFIVTERKNNQIGASTISAWKHPTTQGRYVGNDGSSITQTIKVFCDVIEVSEGSNSETQEAATTEELVVQKFVMPDVYTYLRNAEDRYKTIKTLLDPDNPRLFYDFYVCNGIRCRTHESRSVTRQRNVLIIEDATVEKIAQHTKFAILCGTGGLGKSMMMRHLLLNAIANFDDLKLFPVFVPLKDYDENVDSLFEYTYSKIVLFDRSLTKSQFEQILDNGSCLLLFDGLDEISAGHRRRFERELDEMTDKYTKNMYVLSSRPFQSFVSFERFNLLYLMPFNPRQAMKLIDRLEFRPDEPEIKKKFLRLLEKGLFRTHRSFTENPLLLTIMLLTFEQFAEVPSKMHVFYREAFEVLAKRHDASKGAYKRSLKTGLSVDAFEDYFAELCFRSYNDEKFELTADEVARYYNVLSARATANDNKTTARDFLEDLCSNLCLMYFEGDRYHFTHRSFQEYFCALFFSKQKDKFISKLGDFFERHQRRMYGDRTFYMMYDMITEKAEEFILFPFLNKLFDKCDKEDGYWTFLEEMYPQITYSSEDEYRFLRRVAEPNSFILSAALEICGFNRRGMIRGSTLADLPYYEEFEIERIPKYKMVSYTKKHGDEELEEVEDENAGYVCRFVVGEVRQQPEYYDELIEALNCEDFILKKQYNALHQYKMELADKQKDENDNLLDLL